MAVMQGKLAVVIPALNEERAIRDVVSGALAYCSDVIVIDDGSSDRTCERIADLPVTLIRHATPQGKAFGLQEGFRAALARGCDGVLTLDGDGQHAPADIPRLLAAAAHYPGQIVIGARLLKRERQPGMRRFGNNFADWNISWASGHRIVDSQSGQRYYPHAALELAGVSGPGFVFESEILIEAAWAKGIRTVSVPIESRYPEDRRASHFRPFHDVARIVGMVAGRLIRRGLMPGALWRVLREAPLVFEPDALAEAGSIVTE